MAVVDPDGAVAGWTLSVITRRSRRLPRLAEIATRRADVGSPTSLDVYTLDCCIYRRSEREVLVTKRLVDIDDGLLESAQLVLETTTYKETVNRALAEVSTRRPAGGLTAEMLADFAEATKDLRDPEVRAAAWR